MPDGFAFGAEDIALYYGGIGYTCLGPSPSTKAAGYVVRTCSLVDAAGRTRSIGLVSDEAGAVGNAFGSVEGSAGESVLEPVDALDPLAGFLGATLGEAPATSLLAWLAAHLGDEYAETTIGELKVATYTESADDHSKLFLELAGPRYLAAPPP